MTVCVYAHERATQTLKLSSENKAKVSQFSAT